MQAACLKQLLRAGARDGAARAGWRHTGDKACWMSSGPWLRREVTEQRGAWRPGTGMASQRGRLPLCLRSLLQGRLRRELDSRLVIPPTARNMRRGAVFPLLFARATRGWAWRDS